MDAVATDRPQNVPSVRANDGQSDSGHAAWIAGRVQVLLSHYFQPDNPSEVVDAAIDDWIDALAPFSREAIEVACKKYLCDQPRRRPTPGDIRAKVREPSKQSIAAQGDKSALTYDELDLLETKILPTARRWFDNPALTEQGRRTLAYWGEAS